MKNRDSKNKDLYHLLNQSLYSTISDSDEQVLAKALESNPELKAEKVKRIRLHSLISTQNYRFKPFFASRVMSRIDLAQEPVGLLAGINYAFMRISLPTMLAVFVWFLIFWGAEGNMSVDGLLGVSGLSYDELVTDFFVSN